MTRSEQTRLCREMTAHAIGGLRIRELGILDGAQSQSSRACGGNIAGCAIGEARDRKQVRKALRRRRRNRACRIVEVVDLRLPEPRLRPSGHLHADKILALEAI